MLHSYSTVYTSISGLRLSSSGVTQSYHEGSNPNPHYYSLSRLCDGNLKNAYIVTSSYTNVVITVSLPRNMFIHHIRIYPVCNTYMLFYRPESPYGKICTRDLEYDSRAQLFPLWTDQGRQITCFLTLCWLFIFYVVLRFNKKLEKFPKLEISERSVIRVRMGKSRPQERGRLAYQIQGFWIPGRWEAGEKNKHSSVLSNFVYLLRLFALYCSLLFAFIP